MKLIPSILLLLVVLLSGFPCSDEHTCSVSTEQTGHTTSHDHSQDTGDHCTPFCVCSCCGTLITVDALHEAPTGFSTVQSPILPYSFDYSFFFTYRIWHPPCFV